MSTALRSQTLTKTFRNWLAAIILFTGVAAKAQVSAYTVEQEPLATNALPTFLASPYINLVTGVQTSGVYATPLPFDFTFAGTNYTAGTNVHVSVKGFIAFGAAPAAALTTPISSNGSSGIISVFGSELRMASGHWIRVKTEGTSPNQIFKVEWLANPYAAGDGNTTGLIMQAWLFEGSNNIEFHYRTWNSAQASTATFLAEIGLRGATNADYKNLVHPVGTDWPIDPSTMPEGTSNADKVALRKNNTNIELTSNRLFRFRPTTCFAPNVNPITTFDYESATVTWNPANPVPTMDYNWEIRTSGAPGTPGAVQSGTGVTSPLNITGLAGNTTYYVYIRSQCSAGDASSWSTPQTFTTPCSPAFPYFEYFEQDEPGEPGAPNLPYCTTRQAVAGNQWVVSNAMEEGFMDEHLRIQIPTSGATNSWFFTRAVSLTAGTTYRLSYEYGGATTFDELTNKIEVRYGPTATAAAMATGTLLIDHNEIKDSPLTNVVNFIPTATGIYYIGFKAYSAQNMGAAFLDTIELTLATCFAPTGLGSGAVTPTSATISWTPPATTPSAGYQYYISTNPAAPSSATTPTGNTSGSLANLSGLTPGTTYYFWVRSNCGSGDISGWSTSPGTFTTPAFPAVTYCIPNGGAFAQDPNGIVNVTVGTINNTTGIEPNTYGNYSNLITSVAQGATVPISVTLATGWTYDLTVWVDWNNDGDFGDPGEMVCQGTSTANVPTTTTMTFTVPAGASLGTHRMRVGGMDFGPLTNPCQAGNWQAFEDYTLFVTVPPAPLGVTPSSLTTCSGVPTATAVTLTTPLSNYTNYAWTPAVGVSGDPASGWTFAPTSTTVYTLTGFNTTTFQTNTTSITVNVNQPPTPITITPAGPVNVCQAGPAAQLTASGGIVSGQLIHYEGFNAGLPGTWTSAFQGTGSGTNGHWQVRPNGYAGMAPGVGWGPIHSNDNTSFVISDADAAGLNAAFTARLTSPPIAISNPNYPATEPQYTTASLSFWHHFRYLSGESARVYISTNGFTTQTLLAQYTATQGNADNFANVVFNMTPYIGQTVQIRFEYANVTWDWGWAIDNFLITGSGTSAVTWSPLDGLYNDAAATIPYTGDGRVTVYAMPSTNTTYTAQAMTGTCATQTTVSVNVSPIVAGTITPASQVACGTAANLVLTGTTGTVTMWQYATDAAFTTGVTNIPASDSATLTGAQIGTFAGTRYFRAVVANGGCNAYSAPVSVAFNTKIWNGTAWTPAGAPTSGHAVIFQGNYTQAAGTVLNACSVRVESGNVVFMPNSVLVSQNEVVRAGGTLTFENNASLVQVNNSTNSGYIVYKRNAQPMIQYDYTYWSSPLSPQTLVGLSPNTLSDKYFAYDPIVDDYVQVSANSLMEPGKGYIIRAPQGFNATPQVFEGIFNGGSNNGVPNNGPVSIDIISPSTESFNLIGNPYPSAIDADAFYGANAGLIDGNFYFWTHNTPIDPLNYTQSDYAVWNSTGGSGTAGGGAGNSNVPDGTIAAGQGFFVVGNSVTAGSPLVFDNTMRLIGSNGNFYRPDGTQRMASTAEKHRIWLELTNAQGAYKQVLVGYVEGATNAKDAAFDAPTIDGGNQVNFYSIADGFDLTIQGRSLPFDSADQVPLGFSVTTAGTYSIGIHNFDGLFENQNIYLEDLHLGIIHDLKASNYTFATTAGDFEDRFMLRYDETALGVNQFNDNSVVIYKNTTGIHIHSGVVDIADVKIFDMRGRQITVKANVNERSLTVALDVPQQVLIVQVTAVDGRTVTKKVVY